VRSRLHAQIQIACRAAVRSCFALASGADPRSVLHTGRDADVHASRVAAVLDRDAPGRAVEGLLERQLDRMLDVASLLAARRPAARPAAFARPARAAAEERLEEIRERILIAEEILHLLFGHRPVAAGAATHVDGPGAALTRGVAERRTRPRLSLLLRLLVHPPVGAQLVVLFPLVGIAEHFVRFVDLLELPLGGLVPGIDVGMELPRQLAERLLDLFF
jgi:hypothetical protein